MADSARFSQSHGIVQVWAPSTTSYNTPVTAESINMAKYNHCTLIISGDSACAGDNVFKVRAATSDGGTTADITFTYRYATTTVGVATADVLGTPATSAALTMSGASLVSSFLVIEFDAEDMVVSGVQYQWATPNMSDVASAGIISAVAILSEPRIQLAIMPTAIS